MPGERNALIVAVDEYRDPGLAGLAAPSADADALAAVLADPERGGFRVETLYNQDSQAITERVEALLVESKVDDLVLLHFSCHGIKDATGELYLAATNTRPDRLASTAVDSALVNRLMRRSRAKRVVLLLDCCYGGAFERGVITRAGGTVNVGEQFEQDTLDAGRSRVVITASSALEYAFEGQSLTQEKRTRPSYFTGAVVEGIVTGKADRDNDGRVGLSELYDYVYEQVHALTPNQTPGKWEFGTSGALFIARNPTPTITPVQLADDLLDLIEQRHPRGRLAAIHELTALASVPRLGVALSAIEALRGLVDDDSRRVETEAARALESLAPRVSESVVDFGTIVANESSPVRTITVTGPPLVQSFTISTSPSEVIANRKGREVFVTLDTSTPRLIDGRLTIDSHAGATKVNVTAVIEQARDAVLTQKESEQPITRYSDHHYAAEAPAAQGRVESELDPHFKGSRFPSTPLGPLGVDEGPELQPDQGPAVDDRRNSPISSRPLRPRRRAPTANTKSQVVRGMPTGSARKKDTPPKGWTAMFGRSWGKRNS